MRRRFLSVTITISASVAMGMVALYVDDGTARIWLSNVILAAFGFWNFIEGINYDKEM